MNMNIEMKYEINFDELKDVCNLEYELNDKSVLIVVDINNGFAKMGSLSSERVNDIIPQIEKDIMLFNELNLPVIAFTDCHSENAVEFKYYPKHCVANDIESLIVEELSKYKLDIIKKNSTNGFLAPKFQEKLKVLIEKGFNNFIVTGCVTDICVKQFALTLRAYLNEFDLNGDVIIPVNAVETFDSPIHNANLMNLLSLLEMKSNGIVLVNDIYKKE